MDEIFLHKQKFSKQKKFLWAIQYSTRPLEVQNLDGQTAKAKISNVFYEIYRYYPGDTTDKNLSSIYAVIYTL